MQKVVCKKWCFVMCTKMSILYETGIVANVSYTAQCFARKNILFIFRFNVTSLRPVDVYLTLSKHLKKTKCQNVRMIFVPKNVIIP